MEKQILLDVLKKIKPTKEEQLALEGAVSRFITRLRRSSKRLKINCDFFVGGSFGKDTYLKGSSDVDIFCRFDLKYKDNTLSSLLETILIEAKLKYKKQKGSRDYYSLKFVSKGISIIFEIVPNRKIKTINEVINSTDVSPMHVEFLKLKVEKNPDLTNQIRLAKQFFKSKGLYGAESYIEGFSGHTIDILIAYYGSLKNLLLEAKTWNEEKYIDINNFYSNEFEAQEKIGIDKLSNLILVDPIIKERNAARALNNIKYCEFIMIANKFKKFNKEDFEINKPNIKTIIEEAKLYSKENNLKFLAYKFRFKITNESEDIVGAKLLKLSRKINKYFTSLDFEIFLEDFFIDIKKGICLIIFLFKKTNLPNVKKIIGPKVFFKEATIDFLKDKDYYFIEDSRVCIYQPRTIYKLNEVSKIDLDSFKNMLNKDISFITSVRRIIK